MSFPPRRATPQLDVLGRSKHVTDRADAVQHVHEQYALHRLFGSLEATGGIRCHVTGRAVGVHLAERGQQEARVAIDSGRPRGSFHVGGWAQFDDAALLHDHRLGWQRALAIHRNHGHPLESHDVDVLPRPRSTQKRDNHDNQSTEERERSTAHRISPASCGSTRGQDSRAPPSLQQPGSSSDLESCRSEPQQVGQHEKRPRSVRTGAFRLFQRRWVPPVRGLPLSRHNRALEASTRTPPPPDCYHGRPLEHLLALGVLDVAGPNPPDLSAAQAVRPPRRARSFS